MAIGSGLTTAAITGDLKEGLVSGLTGFGIGKALGAGLDAAKGVKDLAGGVETAKEGVKIAGEAAAKAGQADALAQLGTGIGDATKTAADLASANTALSGAEDILASRSADYAQGVRDLGFQGRLGAMATNPVEVGKGLMKGSSLIPIAVGEGQRSQMDMMRRQEAAGRRFEADQAARKQRAEDLLATSLGQVGSDYGIDVSGANRRYAAYDPSNYANGGLVSINPQEYQRQLAEAQMLGMQPVRMDMGGPSPRFDVPNVRFGFG